MVVLWSSPSLKASPVWVERWCNSFKISLRMRSNRFSECVPTFNKLMVIFFLILSWHFPCSSLCLLPLSFHSFPLRRAWFPLCVHAISGFGQQYDLPWAATSPAAPACPCFLCCSSDLATFPHLPPVNLVLRSPRWCLLQSLKGWTAGKITPLNLLATLVPPRMWLLSFCGNTLLTHVPHGVHWDLHTFLRFPAG